MNIDLLLENHDLLFSEKKRDLNILGSIKDKNYVKFINETNGGFFFNRSLSIYGSGDVNRYSSFVEMNIMINSYYRTLISDAQYFACDFLGNQFAFIKNKIAFVNIESAECEIIANNFAEWIELIYNDLDYYTGQSLTIDWQKSNGLLDYDNRLCPKKPFLIGGEYSIKNLYQLNVETLVKYNYKIAEQVYNLPDGADIQIIVK